MTVITQSHFGGNIVLTRDSATPGEAYQEMLKEIDFSSFRYPGGSVTEHQTWENGGLERLFGPSMEPGSDDYVMTIREALQLSIDHGASLTIVVPTFQFWDAGSKTFDDAGFDRYLDELEQALVEYPEAQIEGFEIGNEYWSTIDATDYGMIASHEIIGLHDLNLSLADQLGSDWEPAGIGIQAGASWRASALDESNQIAQAISAEARPYVTTIYQHAYPNALDGVAGKVTRILKTMEVFKNVEGFGDLKLSLSEFNMSKDGPMGTDQAGHWIETFGQFVEAGIDEIYIWGTQYGWQSNKLYDSLLNGRESNGGDIKVIATPMGQIYDLAESHLIGKAVIDDDTAAVGLGLPDQVNVTGFQGDGQRIVFLHNRNEGKASIDLSGLGDSGHVSVHHLTPADSPYTAQDESDRSPKPGLTVDTRGDMKVRTEGAIGDDLVLAPGDVIMITISDPGRDLVLEGAHNVTNPRTGMVNDHIIGGTGNDILRGHVGNDTLDGGAGNDVIIGGRGDDVLLGGKGNDVLIADQGSDVVDGGEGDDVVLVLGDDDSQITAINAGLGNDIILTKGAQNIEITGFDSGDAIGLGGVFQDVQGLGRALSMNAGDLILTLPGGQEIRFVGGAGLLEQMSELVIDLRDGEQVDALLQSVFSGLSHEQIAEVYKAAPDFGEIVSGVEGWNTAADAIDRVESGHPEQPKEPLPSYRPPAPEDTQPEPGYPGSGAEELGSVPQIPGTGQPPPYADDTDYLPDIYDSEDYLPDPPAEEPRDYDSASGGGCFVATPAYGDRLHPDVVALRYFRDHHLIRTAAGRSFVRFYWIVGPRLAAVTKPHQLHAISARMLLTRLVRVLRALGKTGPPPARRRR